jgi:hypothetical protein
VPAPSVEPPPSEFRIPVFATPCGQRAVATSVQVATGTSASKMPDGAAFQHSPPPSETPQQPTWSLTSGLASSHATIAFMSATSRGPARPSEPFEVPWPRTLNASAA